MMESISAIKARVQELEGFVKDQGGRKDEYAAIMSQQSEGEWVFRSSGYNCLYPTVWSPIMLKVEHWCWDDDKKFRF